eukprot:scaffold17.g492.t1
MLARQLGALSARIQLQRGWFSHAVRVAASLDTSNGTVEPEEKPGQPSTSSPQGGIAAAAAPPTEAPTERTKPPYRVVSPRQHEYEAQVIGFADRLMPEHEATDAAEAARHRDAARFAALDEQRAELELERLCAEAGGGEDERPSTSGGGVGVWEAGMLRAGRRMKGRAPAANAAHWRVGQAAQERPEPRQRRWEQRTPEQREAVRAAQAQAFAAWQREHAEQLAGFRRAAAAGGVNADDAILGLYKRGQQGREALLLPEGAAAGDNNAADAPEQETGAQGPPVTQAELALRGWKHVLADSELPLSVGEVIGAAPWLLRCGPAARRLVGERLPQLAQLMGGPEALANLARQEARALLLRPLDLSRRLALLTAHCVAGAMPAQLLLRAPALAVLREEALNSNTRELGTLMGLHQCGRAIRTHPQLLAVSVQQRLRRLARCLDGLVPGLPDQGLRTMVAFRPGLLLTPPARLAGRWRTLQQACEAVPAWGDSLRQLVAAARGPAPDPPRAVAAGGAAAAAAGSGAKPKQPGCLQKQAWQQLAQLLNTRAWQVPRLLFVAEEYAAEASGLDLLELALAPAADFGREFPGYEEWQERRRTARVAEREAAAGAAAEREVGGREP